MGPLMHTLRMARPTDNLEALAEMDSQGFVALWREGLLAQKVRTGETRGYRHHL